jgi:hypothetical protein
LVGADAIVIGAVTDFSPYYPPRCGLQIEWYATNPGFHPVPPGYGLPWGSTEEEYIPPALKLEAEMALAREQQIEMPITEQVDAILHAGKSPKDAIRNIMERPLKRE